MTLPARSTGLSGNPPLVGDQTKATHASKMALREIETRFTAALIDAAMPKSKSTFGRGFSGSVAREHLVT